MHIFTLQLQINTSYYDEKLKLGKMIHFQPNGMLCGNRAIP